MKIAGIFFTKEGMKLSGRIEAALYDVYTEGKVNLTWYGKGKFLEMDDTEHVHRLKGSIQQWAEECFKDCDVLIFIGASGIAVRAIAPFVRDKRTDPAVVVLDERGKFCISLLSGHIGGANEIVSRISEEIGSIPVITTATDVSHRFAVDVYARKNDMIISNMTYAKEVSAALLAGEPVGFYTNFPVSGKLPDGIFWSEKLDEARADRAENTSGTSLGIYISPSYNRAYFDHTLWLIPKCLVLGIGCRKGTAASEIEKLVSDTLRSYSLYPEAVSSVASIDLKKNEPGLVTFCQRHFVPLNTYSAEELNSLEGSFTGSDFVKKTTGVDNVCERSAVLDSRGQLIIRKTAGDGVTLAVALIEKTISF